MARIIFMSDDAHISHNVGSNDKTMLAFVCVRSILLLRIRHQHTHKHTYNECYIGQYMRVWLKHTHLAKERRTTIGFTHDVTLKVYVCVCAVYLMSV